MLDDVSATSPAILGELTGGHHVLEKVTSRRRETLGFCLEGLDPRGPLRPTPCRLVSLPKKSGEDFRNQRPSGGFTDGKHFSG